MSQQKDLDILLFIAERLKLLRELKKVSQQDVLNDTGIHIARIETGKLNVSVSTISVLCKYFAVSMEEFFRGSI